MEGFDLTFEIRAKADQYEAELRAAAKSGTVLEASQDALKRHGIKTAEAFEKEARELAQLSAALRGDTAATAQLSRAKEKLYADMNRSAGGLGQVERAATSAAGGSGSGLGMLAGVTKLAGGALAGMFAVQTIATGIAGLYEMGTAAEETASKFNTVFGESAGAVDSWGREFFNVAGMTTTEGRGMVATFGALSQGMGIAGDMGGAFFDEIRKGGAELPELGEASANTSAAVLALAGDIASFNNADITDVLQNLQSGLTGEVEPLRKYGIELDAVSVKATALRITHKANEDQLTSADLILARLTLAYEKAGVAVGDLDRTSGSLANRTRFLEATVKDQAETFASQLVPSMGMVVNYFGDLVQGSGEAGATLGGQLAGALREGIVMFLDLAESVGGFLTQLWDSINAMLRATGVVSGSIKPLDLFKGAVWIVARAFDGLGIIISRVTEYMLRARRASLETGASLRYAVGDLDGYARLQTQAALTTVEIDRLRTASDNYQEGAGRRRANAALDSEAAGAATTATEDQTTATQAATAADADATKTKPKHTRAVRVHLTALQEVTAEYAKQTAALTYYATANGRAALVLEGTNAGLSARVRALHETAELAGLVDFWASAEGRAALVAERTNAVLRERVRITREGLDVVPLAFRQRDGTVEYKSPDELATAARDAERERENARRALREYDAEQAALPPALRSRTPRPGERRAADRAPAPSRFVGPMPYDARPVDGVTYAPGAAGDVAFDGGSLGEAVVASSKELSDEVSDPWKILELTAGESAGVVARIWGGTLDVLTKRFGESADVGSGAFAQWVEASETVARASGAAFGMLSSAAADAYEASGESAGAFFALHKAFAIGEAIANTYKAATGAYAALAPIPIVGPALGAVAAGAAIAAGLVNVAKIRAAQPGGSGGGGGGGGGASGVNATGYATAGSAGTGGTYTGPTPAGALRPAPSESPDAAGMREAAADLRVAADRLADDGIAVHGNLTASGDELRGTLARTDQQAAAVGTNRSQRRGVVVA